MKVLVAMDKFKGSLTALEACRAVERGLKVVLPEAEVALCGIADGGEGTVDALGGERVSCCVLDAQGRSITAHYAWLEGEVAVMEMSAASGLALVSDLPLQPETASTFGTGQMMLHAMERGAKRLVIGIGGSATNDGGRGMAEALGFCFEEGRISASERVFPPIDVACDVDNPLLGSRGATAVYGPQKGVKDVTVFEQRLVELEAMVRRDLDADVASVPGAGAAGGLGFGLMAFCGARLVSGFDLVAEVIGLREKMVGVDMVVTGEGRLDEQSLMGKGPAGVAGMAKEHGARVMGVAGSIRAREALAVCFDLLIQSKPEEMALEEAMKRGAALVEESVVRHGAAIRELVTQ
jgi:glycerate 2-kinase